jgi:hypothetical protein
LRNYSYDTCYTPTITGEPTNGVLSIAFDFYRPGTGGYSDVIEILGNNQCGVVSITFDRSSNYILVNKGWTTEYNIGSFTSGNDYSIIVYKDDISKTFSLKLNGTMVLENIAWESWANTGISYITIKGGGNTGAWAEPYAETNKSYFGDITVATEASQVSFSPAGGTHPYAQPVIITAPDSSVIRYTTNGSDPTTSSTQITSGQFVVVDENLTLKARAWINGVAGAVQTAEYKIAPEPYLWKADFDTYTLTTEVVADITYSNTLTGQNGWWGNGSPEGEIVEENGQKIARIGSMYGTWRANRVYSQMIDNEPTNGVLKYEFSFYRPGTGEFSDAIKIYDGAQNGFVTVLFDRSDSKIKANGIELGSFEAGTDYKIVVYKDDVHQTYSVELNDQRIISDQAWAEGVTSGITYFQIDGGGNEGNWVTNYPNTQETNQSYFGNIAITVLHPEEQTAFPLGWWGRFDANWVNEMGMDDTNITLTYNMDSSYSTITSSLDMALYNGIKVIVELPRESGTGVTTSDTAAITDFIRYFDSHPAVYGWFIGDEPASSQHAQCKTAYDTIKQISTKPVAIVFCHGKTDEISEFADAYDLMLFDKYTAWNSISEFGNLEAGTVEHAKTDIDLVGSLATSLGKPWMAVLQGFGNVPAALPTWRLPTWGEERFLLYYCVDKGTQGWLSWAQYQCKDTIAVSSDPYPYDGAQWNIDVYRPLVAEINTLGPALAEGRLSDSLVSDNSSLIKTSLWQDPDTGSYYLIAVNTTSTATSAVVTLAFSGQSLSTVEPLFENRQAISFTGNSFSDSFSQYQVHVYELTFTAVTRIPGDANNDRLVDVGDLGILAANYGTTSGATWSQGDFNGDGLVDVGDLGILAANYGTSASGADFNVDYAKVFGESTAEETSADDDSTSSTLCSSLGLSLIVGLGLMGLLFGKFKE